MTKKRSKTLELFKTTVSIDVMTMAYDKEEAGRIAKICSANETEYFKCESSGIYSVSDIPDNWRDMIPYYPEGEIVPDKKCSQLVTTVKPEEPIVPIDPVASLAEPAELADEPIAPVEPIKPIEEHVETPEQPKPPLPLLNFDIPPKRKKRRKKGL